MKYVPYIIKIIDIGFLTCIYFTLGVLTSAVFDNFYGCYDEKYEDQKSTFQLMAEILFHVFLVGIAVYLLQVLVMSIPFPLDGVQGYHHGQTRELLGGVILTFSVLKQDVLRNKINLLYQRLTWY